MTGASDRVLGYDVESLRSQEFPWATRREAIYLDNASTGPLPERTVRAAVEFAEKRARPFVLTDDDEFGTLHRSRHLVARLLGTRPGRIALMVNTSYGLNLAARALPLQPGDVIIAPDREFPANVYPWMALSQRGIGFERVPTVAGLPDEEALLRALDRPRVRVLAVSWVSFATGYRVDLERLGRACADRGVYFVVDAIQGVGATPLDVDHHHIDLLACGGQKWLLSPWGSGFVYVRESLVQQLEPVAVGWMATRASEDFTRLCEYDPTFLDDARRFEVITLPYQDFAAFNASLELLLELGPSAVERHVRGVVDVAIAWAGRRRDVRLVTPADPEKRSGIVALAPRDPVQASRRLTKAGVAHSLREGAIRLSPHCYNTTEEMEVALDLLGG